MRAFWSSTEMLSGLEDKILPSASVSASELWPWPRPWPQTFGLGLGLGLEILALFNIGGHQSIFTVYALPCGEIKMSCLSDVTDLLREYKHCACFTPWRNLLLYFLMNQTRREASWILSWIKGRERNIGLRKKLSHFCCVSAITWQVNTGHRDCQKYPSVKKSRALSDTPSQSYGMSITVWDHTVLPVTRHKWTDPALTPHRGLYLIYLPTYLPRLSTLLSEGISGLYWNCRVSVYNIVCIWN